MSLSICTLPLRINRILIFFQTLSVTFAFPFRKAILPTQRLENLTRVSSSSILYLSLHYYAFLHLQITFSLLSIIVKWENVNVYILCVSKGTWNFYCVA